VKVESSDIVQVNAVYDIYSESQEKRNAKVESSDIVQVNAVCNTYSNSQEQENAKGNTKVKSPDETSVFCWKRISGEENGILDEPNIQIFNFQTRGDIWFSGWGKAIEHQAYDPGGAAEHVVTKHQSYDMGEVVECYKP